MERARVSLAGVDIAAGELSTPGGPLPRTWQGRRIRPVEEPPETRWAGPVPRTGWRAVGDSADGVLLAAPASDGDRWWTCLLLPAGDEWRAHVSWPEPLEAAATDLAAAFELTWPDVETWPLLELPALQVQVRPLGAAAQAAYSASELPATHVVGFLSDPTTGTTLPHDPWQAFTGFGPAAEPDADGVVSLPVRWLVDDLADLAPGRYAVRATLLSLKLTSASKPITFT